MGRKRDKPNPKTLVDVKEEDLIVESESESELEDVELSPEELIESVQENRKDREISRMREEVKHLKRLYKTQTQETSGVDALISAIRECVPTMKAVAPPRRKVSRPEVDKESLVLLLSDLHIGEVVSITQTGGISSFDVDIARRRIQFTVDRAIKIAKEKMNHYEFDTLYVFMLGDLISGIIHDELRVNDELGIVAQCIEAVDIISEAILKLCQEFPHVHVASVAGNHGRVTEERYFKGKATNNYDYLISKMIEKLLSNQSNLTWNIPEAFFTVETVENESFLLLHGDVVKSWMGIPFYGLQRAYLKWRTVHADFGTPFKHMIVGHYHNPNMMSIVRYKLIINGCIKGGDEYSIGALAAACDPSQTMFGVNAKRGITHYWELNSKEIV
jgi:hypothetical protein